MAKQGDEATGCCCGAIIVIVLALMAATALLDFIKERPVLSVVIGIAVMLIVGLLISAFVADDEEGKAGTSQVSGSRPVGTPRTTAAATSCAETSHPRCASLEKRGSLYRKVAVRLRHLEVAKARNAAPEGAEDPPAGQLDALALRADATLTTSSAAVSEPSMPVRPGEHRLSEYAAGPDSDLGRSGPEQNSSGAAGVPASADLERWALEDLQWIIEKSLRRDDWAIFRAGFDSARGGLDVIAGRGQSKIAVQCYKPERSQPLDGAGLRRLLTAPFDVHDIVEVVVVAQSGVLKEAREMAASSKLRIHFIDGNALEAWRHWEARLEPQWGLVSLIN